MAFDELDRIKIVKSFDFELLLGRRELRMWF
jgi:hypothetical protein